MAKLLKSASIFGGWTFVSRILGLARDVLFARFFGAGVMMDVFKVTFAMPNYFRRLFAEGAFLQAFVPVLNEVKENGTEAEVKSLVADTSGTLATILFIFTVIGVIAAPVFVFIFAPGFFNNPENPQAWGLSVELLRWTFPYLLFISLTALSGGVLNTYGKFGVPAFTPIILNITLITFVVWVSPFFEIPIYAASIGVFVAGVLQLFFQFPFLQKLKMLSWPRWGWKTSGVRKIFKLMLPGIFGSSVAQLNLLIDSAIASMLAAGSISYLYYSDRLMELPLGIFAIAIATVALPRLSSQHANQSHAEFSHTLDWSLRAAFVICLPAAVGLVSLAGPLISTIFQHGEFDVNSVIMTRYSLWAFGFGLFGFVLVKVLVPGYFSRQDTKTPVKIGIIAIIVNVTLNLIVLALFLTGNWETAPHAGLAAATSVGAFVNALLLYRGLRKSKVFNPEAGWLAYLSKIFTACALMAAVLLLMSGDLHSWTSASAFERINRLAMLIGAGAGTYFLVLFVLGVRPRHFLKF